MLFYLCITHYIENEMVGKEDYNFFCAIFVGKNKDLILN